MKAYILTTGALFVLITVAHVWRMIVERHYATEPWYIVITLLTAVLSIWAWRLAMRSPAP